MQCTRVVHYGEAKRWEGAQGYRCSMCRYPSWVTHFVSWVTHFVLGSPFRLSSSVAHFILDSDCIDTDQGGR